MAFTAIKLENFKRFNNEKIDISKNITLLLGPNSSGKSSLIKSLLALKQTFYSSNEHEVLSTHGEFVDLGVFKDFVYKHDTKKVIKIGVEFDTDGNSLLFFLNLKGKVAIDFSFIHDTISEQARLKEINISFVNGTELIHLMTLSKKATRNSFLLKYNDNVLETLLKRLEVSKGVSESFSNGITLYHHEKFRFSTKEKNNSDDEKSYLSDIPTQFFLSFINDFSNRIQDELFYLGPLRKSPARSYTKTSHNKYVGPNGEHTPSILADLERRSKKVTRGESQIKESYESFISALETLFPNREVKIRLIEELVKVNIQKNNNDSVVKSNSESDVLSDVGFGFSQIFPVLVQACVMPSGTTLIIEQPELHLHPMAQASLAKVIAKLSRAGKRFIIETHSEHFLRGLQLEVSENKLNSSNGIPRDQLKILYVPEAPEKIKTMEINEWGEIETEWPSGFFDEAYKLAFALMQNKSKSLSKNGVIL